jgi:hypothetical protein
VRVTSDERVRFRLRCVAGEVACTGSVRVLSQRPVSPGRGKPRRILTLAEGAYREIPAGEVRTVTLKLHADAVARVRKYRTTAATWQMFWPDGNEQFIFIPHTATAISNAVRS